MYKQREYQKIEFEEKLKYEKKIVSGLKLNTKPFFRYLRSKNKIRKTVNELVDEDGNKTKTPKETAESLLNFFQSVFKGESFGPLPEKCFENKNITGKKLWKA